jgi:hypothetical protein
VWLVAGAAVVGVGIAAAIWSSTTRITNLPGGGDPASIASRDAPAIVPPLRPAAPTAQPIEPPPTRAELVEVRLDSLPSGGVFADGHAAELCRTPCTFRIDPADGGPTDRRAFVVRRGGYTDGTVTVDLTGKDREFHVTLQQTGSADAAGSTRHPEIRPDRHPPRHSPRPLRPAGPAKDSSTKDSSAKDSSAKDSSAKDRGPAMNREITRDPTLDVPLHPAETRPPAKQPAIDPADTLDPFHKK